MSEQPRIDDHQGRVWLFDRYDGWALPPGAAAFVLGPGHRPWERKPQARRHYDDHVARPRS